MARVPGFPDNPTEGGRVPGASCGIPLGGTGDWDKWVPFCFPGGSQGRLSESKRALNSGDPGWIRTSDPQLRRLFFNDFNARRCLNVRFAPIADIAT